MRPVGPSEMFQSFFFLSARCHYTTVSTQYFYASALFDLFLSCALFWWSSTKVLKKKTTPPKKRWLLLSLINPQLLSVHVWTYWKEYILMKMSVWSNICCLSFFMVSYNWGVRVNVIFVFSKKHNHIRCSVNHSGDTLQFKLKILRRKRESAKHTSTAEAESGFLSWESCFVLWQFSTQLDLWMKTMIMLSPCPS